MTSTLKINTIEPEGATTTLTVGESGQNTVIAGAGIKANVAKDAGANALFTSDGSGTLSGLNSGFGSAQTLIQSQTVTNQATVSFTSDIDSTYKEYVFEFFNINPATDNTNFSVQFNVAGQSGFNETMTTTYFNAYHQEDDGATALSYTTAADQAQGTAYQSLANGVGNASDENCSGVMHLFNPASTTYVKNFYSRASIVEASPAANDIYVAGYVNVTGAIDEVSFKMSSGNFDGTIKMYGIK